MVGIMDDSTTKGKVIAYFNALWRVGISGDLGSKFVASGPALICDGLGMSSLRLDLGSYSTRLHAGWMHNHTVYKQYAKTQKVCAWSLKTRMV